MIKHIFFSIHPLFHAGIQAAGINAITNMHVRFEHILTLILLFVFFQTTYSCFASDSGITVSTNNTMICFSPDNLTNSICERILYPIDYSIDFNLTSVPSWLECCPPITYTGVYQEIKVYVKPFFRWNQDAADTMLKTCLAHKENGQVGHYDVPGESGPPNDLYEFIKCEWDPASNSIYPASETNKFAFLGNSIPPDIGYKTYTLFKSVSSNNVQDIDYYLLWPRSRNYDIWIHNKSNFHNSLKLSIIQNNEEKITKIIDKSNKFILALSCTNLNENLESYVKVEHPIGSVVTNKQYSLYCRGYYEVKEGKEWENSKVSACLSNGCQQVIYSFKPLNKKIVFEVSSDTEDSTLWNSLNISFYDNSYQQYIINDNNVFSGTIPDHLAIGTATNGYFKRFTIDNLQVSNTYYCVVKSNINLDSVPIHVYARISRVKPVFLIHGIDSSPKSEKDPATAFGDLKDSNPYYDIRPFKAYDFVWDSAEKGGILKDYVGFEGQKLGEFISDNRNIYDLKGTIVAHSMGCLLTYYQCKENNVHFRQNIDNIVLAAPPFFGSALANTSDLLDPISPIIKKTSDKNLEILQRGTSYNWERHKHPFAFNNKNISVLIGTDKHETIYDIAVYTVDSLGKLTGWKAITDAQVVLDAGTDVLFDFIESTMELTVGTISRASFMMNPVKTSEVYYLNRSDGVVGTYSAYFSKDIDAEEIEKTHSYVQKFNSNNDIFVNKVKNRINNIEK